MLLALPGDRHAQFPRVRPIQLQARAGFPRLREENLPWRSVVAAPAEHPALERAQRPLGLRRLLLGEQVLATRPEEISA